MASAGDRGDRASPGVYSETLLAAVDDLSRETRIAAMRSVLAKEETSRRMAAMLEAECGQLLANAVMELHQAQGLVETEPGLVRRGLEHLEGELQQGLDRWRWMITKLEPPLLLQDLGLGPSMVRYVERFATYSGLSVTADTLQSFDRRLPSTVELSVFRIIQQALENVHQHARATHVEVGVEMKAGMTDFFVRDDGCGFQAPLPERSLGLIDMRERAEAIQATLRVSSGAGLGTHVILTIAM